MHVKKGDKVMVIAGKEKGKTGNVLRVFPATNKVIVEALNIYKRHKKGKKQGEKSTVVNVEMPMHASNVKLAVKKEKTEKPAKAEKVAKKKKAKVE